MTTRCPTAWSLYMAWCNTHDMTDERAYAYEAYRYHLRNCQHCREWWKTVCAEDDERFHS